MFDRILLFKWHNKSNCLQDVSLSNRFILSSVCWIRLSNTLSSRNWSKPSWNSCPPGVYCEFAASSQRIPHLNITLLWAPIGLLLNFPVRMEPVMSQILFPFLVVMNALVVAIAWIQARSISQVCRPHESDQIHLSSVGDTCVTHDPCVTSWRKLISLFIVHKEYHFLSVTLNFSRSCCNVIGGDETSLIGGEM